MQPADKKSDATESLRTAILTLELPPGADLDEAGLCAQYDLSRTPMREVLRHLAGEGYVTLRQNRGAQVSEMSHQNLRAFFIAAPMIYGAILQLAAAHRSEAQLTALQEAQDRFRTALRDGTTAERALANTRFHRITGDMADNPFLAPSFNRLLLDHARISMTFYQPRDAGAQHNVDLACKQHDQIIAAITARDAVRARQLADAHWQLSRDQISQFVMPGGLDLPLGNPPQEVRA
ncbi:GntR family transcriptional regulator [Tateyamaria sp. SN6-1]|uniref:GntR family transcriptional regulator n=1 Tax=Tateyamaria sp. SN6-1 TaxID=3092148 RepID=UPI0039F54F0A